MPKDLRFILPRCRAAASVAGCRGIKHKGFVKRPRNRIHVRAVCDSPRLRDLHEQLAEDLALEQETRQAHSPSLLPLPRDT
jgi:hypothetical protein